jgi:hypothetical protein
MIFFILTAKNHAIGKEADTATISYDHEMRAQKSAFQHVKGRFSPGHSQQALCLNWSRPLLSDSAADDNSVEILYGTERIGKIEDYRVDFCGTCRSHENGLDQLVFEKWGGGFGAAARPTIVFIYYNESHASFSSKEFFSNHKADLVQCPAKEPLVLDPLPEGCSCIWPSALKRWEQAERISREVYDLLSVPVGIELPRKNHRGIKDTQLPVRVISDQELERVLRKARELKDTCGPVVLTTENPRWEVRQIYCSTDRLLPWGVLLARKKRENHVWTSFYNMPTGLKVFVHVPKIQLFGDELFGDFCLQECDSWGFYKPVRIKLETMEIMVTEDVTDCTSQYRDTRP